MTTLMPGFAALERREESVMNALIFGFYSGRRLGQTGPFDELTCARLALVDALQGGSENDLALQALVKNTSCRRAHCLARTDIFS